MVTSGRSGLEAWVRFAVVKTLRHPAKIIHLLRPACPTLVLRAKSLRLTIRISDITRLHCSIWDTAKYRKFQSPSASIASVRMRTFPMGSLQRQLPTIGSANNEGIQHHHRRPRWQARQRHRLVLNNGRVDQSESDFKVRITYRETHRTGRIHHGCVPLR